MCISDIVSFIKLYLSEKSYINSGSYNYIDINEVNNFGYLMTKELEKQFKENYSIDLYTGNTVYCYVFNKQFTCEIEKTSLKGKYKWIVKTEDHCDESDFERYIDV